MFLDQIISVFFSKVYKKKQSFIFSLSSNISNNKMSSVDFTLISISELWKISYRELRNKEAKKPLQGMGVHANS